MAEKIKIGVVGTGRGYTFMRPSEATGLKLTAICDRREIKLQRTLEKLGNPEDVETYTDYDEMLEKADIDAVVLANYFHEHAPFAIKALRAGKHVLSECIAMGSMAEAAALCRAVEETGKIYMLAENYPYTKLRMEMKRLYDSGELGELIYGEGEYMHPMDIETLYNISPGMHHWRNQTPSTYYCTHAIAPLMYISGTDPVRVTGFVPKIQDQSYRGGEVRAQDPGGIIVCEMSNGSIVRTVQGAVRSSSNITTLHCTRGMCEMDRLTGMLTVQHTSFDRQGNVSTRTYMPDWPMLGSAASSAGHSGGDFWVQYYFGEAIRNNEQPWMNVYRACAASAIGILAWRSACNGGIPYDIPDFTNEEERKKLDDDTWTPFRGLDADPDDVPTRTLSPWKPTAEGLEAAHKFWEERDYMGLGWSKADAQLAKTKM